MTQDPLVIMADTLLRIVTVEAIKAAVWLVPLAAILYVHAKLTR